MRLVQQGLAADSPVAGFFGKVHGLAAEMQRYYGFFLSRLNV